MVSSPEIGGAVAADAGNPPAPRVSVLIPAARQPERLQACLESLAGDGCRTPREVLVLANGATAEVLAVARRQAGITLLESAVNLGVPGGYNRLRSRARGELLVLTHDDVELAPGWLDALVETFDAHPEAGMVGGLVLWPDGGLRGAGWLLWRNPSTSPRWRTPPALEELNAVEPVDYLSGSFVAIRAATFDRVGGLDEELYPAYFVDVSLALAVRAAGQVVLLDPRARQRHHEGTLRGPYATFVATRNAARVRQRWGEQLERDHEPHAETDEAYAAAARRTREVAARIAAERRWEDLPAPPALVVDEAAQERRALRAEAELRAAFAAQLGAWTKRPVPPR